MAAILDGQYVKKFQKLHEMILLTQYWPKFIQSFLRIIIVIFMYLHFSVTAADGHLGLPSVILIGLYLQIILIESD